MPQPSDATGVVRMPPIRPRTMLAIMIVRNSFSEANLYSQKRKAIPPKATIPQIAQWSCSQINGDADEKSMVWGLGVPKTVPCLLAYCE